MAVERDHAVRDPADGEDGGLRRIDDGVERVDAVHAEVADREPTPLDVSGPQFASLSAAHHVLTARGNLGQPQRVSAVDDGDYEAVVDRDGKADVDVGV